jgi:hypothetical protein
MGRTSRDGAARLLGVVAVEHLRAHAQAVVAVEQVGAAFERATTSWPG